MRLNSSIILFFLLAGLPAQLQAEVPGPPWSLQRDRDGIQVYTSRIEGSRHNAVLTRTVVDGIRLSAMVALIEDAEACPEWADRCAESYVHERISETEALVYTYNDLPYPLKDRDVLARLVWQQNPLTLGVLLQSNATRDILPTQKSRLRLVDANVSWQFNPLPEGGIEIINQAHVNPGSAVPGWLTNMLLVDTPFETVKAFIAEVKKDKYKDAQVGFITEP